MRAATATTHLHPVNRAKRDNGGCVRRRHCQELLQRCSGRIDAVRRKQLYGVVVRILSVVKRHDFGVYNSWLGQHREQH